MHRVTLLSAFYCIYTSSRRLRLPPCNTKGAPLLTKFLGPLAVVYILFLACKDFHLKHRFSRARIYLFTYILRHVESDADLNEVADKILRREEGEKKRVGEKEQTWHAILDKAANRFASPIICLGDTLYIHIHILFALYTAPSQNY